MREKKLNISTEQKHLESYNRKNNMFLKKYNNFLVYFLLFLIILIGSWSRLSGIFTNSFGYTYDVGRDLLAVQQIVVYHKIPLIGATTGMEGVFYGPWWYYILTIPFIISGGNPQGIAIFIALTGIFSIFLAFVIGRKISGNFLGISFASLISFSPMMVGFTAQIWNPNLIPFFMIIFLLLVYKVFNQNASGIIFLALGLILGLSIETEIVFGLLMLMSSIFMSIIFLKGKIRILDAVFIFIGFLIIILPKIFFELRHNFLMTKVILNGFLGKSPSVSISIFDSISNRVNIFGNIFSDAATSQNRILSLGILFLISFTLVLFYKKTDKQEKFFIKISLLTILVFFLGLTVFSHNIWGHYFIGLPVFYLLLLCLSLNLIKKYFNSKVAFLLLIFLAWINLSPVNILANYQKPIWEGNSAIYRNQLAVIDYVYKEAQGKNFNYIVYTPPVHDYTYKYLFSWYGHNKYGYEPTIEKQKLFFVIMEPDFEDPNRLTNWLKIREGDGKVAKEEVVKGGIKVQTRYH